MSCWWILKKAFSQSQSIIVTLSHALSAYSCTRLTQCMACIVLLPRRNPNCVSCNGSSNGEITFSIDNTSGDLGAPFTWTLFKRDATNNGVAVSGYENISQISILRLILNLVQA